MSDVELTELFVQYVRAQAQVDSLGDMIKQEVTRRGEPFKAAGLVASYSPPSTGTPLYEEAAKEAMPDGFDLFMYTTTTNNVRWKQVCEALNVQAKPGPLKSASVNLKLKETSHV